MNLIELSYYLQNEEAAREYLLDQGILKRFTHCPHCNAEKVGSIRRDRMKCYKCKKEWHRRKDSFLESRHISYAKFVGLLKLLSDEYGVTRTSKDLDLDIKSVIEIFESIRGCLYKAYLTPISTMNDKKIYISSMTNSEIIATSRLDQVNSECYGLLTIVRKKSIERSYSFEVSYIWQICKSRKIKNQVNRFIRFIKNRMVSFRGLSYKNFNSYFFELLIRYNNINEDYAELLISALKTRGG